MRASAGVKSLIVGVTSSASEREPMMTDDIERKRQNNAIRNVALESIIQITKNASTFHIREKKKIECLAPWLSLVRKTGSHITLRR